eukprot:XP_011661827.1 PREDICTED: uncharacterized protein LOC100890777 [Strongylocentrotus purpuratus]
MTTAAVSSCGSNPCQNGATCSESIGGFICECPFGYTGIRCDTDLTPNFNFSQARGLSPADFGVNRSAYQPYYTLADHYNPLQTMLGNQHQAISKVPCRDNMMDCIKLTGATSRLNPMTSVTGTCIQELENCPQGFAISMWLFLDSEAIDGVPSKLLSVEDGTLSVPYVRLMITAQRAIEFSVNDGLTLAKRTILAGKVRWNQWFNFGASWKPGSAPLVFVNSKRGGQSSQSDVTQLMDTSTNREVWLGSKETADSAAPVTMSDFVYWDRFLFDFENHRYLGMTDEEQHLFFTADHWWTVDGFTRRDHLLLAGHMNDVASTTPIRTDEHAVTVLTSGRDGKGRALDVNGESGFWLFFGEHAGTCISDPSLCDDGITVATWMRLTDHHDNEFHCLLSSGGQTTRGFAIYQTGQKLRAMVANGERQWIVEVPFDEFEEWIHIALAWNLTTGLYLYLDGNTRGIDNKGVYRVREADLDNKLIVGRRNDFLSDYAQVGFEELAIWERFVEPWETRRVFGLIENSVYSKAAFYWTSQSMITSTFDLLEAGKTADIIPGPSSDVTVVIEDDETFVELHPDSYLSLGTFPTSCLTVTDLCLTGFSLSIWLKSPVNAPITGHHLHIESRSLTLTVTYYTAVAIVMTSDLVWTTTVPVAKHGAWYNIAVTWNRFESLVVYIDGIEPDGATSTIETNMDVQPSSMTEVGISSTTEGTLITDLALWYQFTYPRKAFTLLGLTDSEGYCQSFGRYCWTFQPPLSRVDPFTASDTDIVYTTSSNYTGKAVVTDGVEGFLTLGDFEGVCPSDPAECEHGFALGLWVKLEAPETEDSSVRHIVSLGADKNGEKGMALIQAEGNIRAIVADGTKRWEVDTTEHNVTYGKWMYIGMIWEATNGLKIVFDGAETAEEKSGTVSTRNKEAYSVITVGKSAVWPIGYQAGAYDEIMLMVPETADAIPLPEDLNGVGSVRYRSADQYFDVTDPSGPVEAVNTSLVEDRFHSENGAISTGDPVKHNFGYVSIGDYAGKCLSDPSICSPAGMTVSFWVQLDNIDHFQDVATNPEGLGYILSSGAQVANSRGFSVTYDGTTVTTEAVSTNMMWTASFDDADFGRNWTNFAITWSSVSGLEVLTDGELRATDPLGTSLSSATTDTHTVVHLGKRNDQESGYLGGAFDDVAIWIYTIDFEDDDELSQLLGELGLDDLFITDDYTQLLNSGPTTGKEECRVLHEADCARSLTELEDITNEELYFGNTAQTSMRRRLLHLAQSEDIPSTNELAAAVNIASTLALVVQPFSNKTLAENAIKEFIQTVDALLDANRTEKWIELQKIKPGSTDLVHSLEDYITQAARDFETSDTFQGCQEFFETTTIATCVDKFVSESFGSNGPVTLPVYGNESAWRGVEARWSNLKEEVTLPQNLFDFTIDGNEGILVLSIYDALDEVIPQNTSKDFVSTSTAEPWVNSRVVSLKVYPSLRRELYNPVRLVFVHTKPPDIVDMVFVWSARALVGISGVFLLLLICIFICFTRVRTLRHLIHANVAISVMIAIIFLCLATVEWSPLICRVMAALFEYFCLVFVFWLLIESIQALTDVHFGYRHADRIISAPGLIVGVTIAINIDAYGELDCGLCWVTDEHDIYLSFYGPLGVCFGLTMLFLFIVKRELDKFKNTGPLRSSMLATCVISIVNVGAWAAGYLGFYGPTVIAYYVFLLTFASMGIFIFLMYGLSAGQLKLLFGKKLKGRGKVRGIGKGRNTPVQAISIVSIE